MPKLATPLQYAAALDGLNEVRPLQLTDEVKTTLDIPVLCVNPLSKNRPAVGKLARCTEQGALLISNNGEFTGWVQRYREVYHPTAWKSWNVPANTRLTMIMLLTYSNIDEIWITNSDNTVNLKQVSLTEKTYCILPIGTIGIALTYTGIGHITIRSYNFY